MNKDNQKRLGLFVIDKISKSNKNDIVDWLDDTIKKVETLDTRYKTELEGFIKGFQTNIDNIRGIREEREEEERETRQGLVKWKPRFQG